ncbi:alpha/beta hydrolase [Streptomyces scopuliridis]|uniref:Alpha/beta hydrolase n=2 Tax=Streptomyces scopuliridis TaxID=452529 RepID=A0ACD4ZDP9_9ACTN|nr:alpha/beta fold hydrolase [Streptomyces scopuliridis]WSB95931.1 alpha/beta hydrolase [Streptomyces scopuliridis]WSC10361.1 alpha/beta hydrolase [Streptomyces scopuliridis]
MFHDGSERLNARRARRWRPLIAAVAIGAFTASVVSCSDREETGVPDVAALAGPLADQELVWEACDFSSDGPPIPGADTANVKCATVKVPRDWLDPDPEVTWDVRISQARNIDPSDPGYHTTVIAHPGGPYASGLSYSTAVQMYTPELRSTTNYVSFDQRGLGQSSHAECKYEYDPAGGPSAAAKAIGEACSKDADVATMTTEQAAYDMDFIRHLLGLDKVTYMGYSYGTWLGAWYGSLFSDNIERMVLDSATDSTQKSIQTLYNAAHEGRDRQFRLHMMNWISRNDEVFGLGTDPEAVWKRYFAATSTPEKSLAAQYAWNAVNGPAAFSNPIGYRAAGSLVAGIIAEGEAPSKPVVPAESAARVVDQTELTDEQRAAAHKRLALLAAPHKSKPGEPIRGKYDYVIEFTACTDGQWTQGLDYWEDFHKRTAPLAPLSEQFGLLVTPTCAFWPTESKMPTQDDSFPETIVLQSELDSMTPFEQGWAAGTGLPNTSLIAVDNESVHGVFPYGTEEVDRPVIDFLLGGDRPAQTIVAAGKPLPLEQSTYESWTPLDENAEHGTEAPLFTDPTIPAETGVVREPRS